MKYKSAIRRTPYHTDVQNNFDVDVSCDAF